MLPTVLWLALFLLAVGLSSYIIRGINKNIFLLKNALIWLLILIVLAIFAILPHVAEWLAMAFEFETASNFLLSAAVIVPLIMEIKSSVLTSRYENRIKALLQELSIMKSEENKKDRQCVVTLKSRTWKSNF